MRFMDVYIHTEVIESMNRDEKYELLNEANFLSQNNQSRIILSHDGGFRHMVNILTGKNNQLRRQIELDSNQLNKIIIKILCILNQDIQNIEREQLRLGERVENLENYSILVMSIQKKMLDKLPDADKNDMGQLSNYLNDSLLDVREKQQETIFESLSNNLDTKNNSTDDIEDRPKKVNSRSISYGDDISNTYKNSYQYKG